MFISKEIHEKELKRSILKSEDILFAIAGATIGKCAIVSEDILPANTNQALAIIRLNENINVKYIFNFLQSLEMKKYIEKFNKTSA
ncbi:restriction endonuclease subunit S [Empedobacter falsenii]